MTWRRRDPRARDVLARIRADLDEVERIVDEPGNGADRDDLRARVAALEARVSAIEQRAEDPEP